VTVADFGHPVKSFGLIDPKNYKLFGIPMFTFILAVLQT
jgi:hypothetical protein